MLKVIVNYIGENPKLRKNELDPLLLEVDFKEIEKEELKDIIKKNKFLTSSNHIMQQLLQKNEEENNIFQDPIDYKNKFLSFKEKVLPNSTENLKYTYGIIAGLWCMFCFSLGINFVLSENILFMLFISIIIF
jgi:hypothetical protein